MAKKKVTKKPKVSKKAVAKSQPKWNYDPVKEPKGPQPLTDKGPQPLPLKGQEQPL